MIVKSWFESLRLHQVASGKRYWSDGTPVAGQQFEYAHDDIGNRTSTEVGGDGAFGGLRGADYTANRRNQYTQRDVPAYGDILGIANPTADVTVNGNTATRKGEYFDYPLYVDNSSAPQYPTVAVVSTYGGKETNGGNVYLPETPESFSYDLDGNLTNDGRWCYFWDGENRLVMMTNSGTVSVPSAAKRKLEFVYDAKGRRVQKTVSEWTGSAWSVTLSNRFVYDGWNLIAELNATNNSVIRTYAWGSDLNGTLQGTGGVGGLLMVSDSSATAFVASDANGNVTRLFNASNAGSLANYEYGPFGEPIRTSGSKAQANPLCFSTKFTDNDTHYLYYGHRYYNYSTGRWPNRDPIAEQGGFNLYQFLRDAPLGKIDFLGMGDTWPGPYPGPGQIWPPSPKNPPLPPPPAWPPTLSQGNSCANPDVAKAIGLANRAMHKGKCLEWFINHGARKENYSVNCHGDCKLPCLFGGTTWTYKGFGIGVCEKNVKGLGAIGLASLLIHEAGHHYCPLTLGRESCAESAQDACEQALSGD